MNLGNFGISTKIFFVIGLIARVAGGIAGTAYRGLLTLSAATDEIDLTATECLGRAAQLQDVGKIGVPDRVLFEKGSLTGQFHQQGI